MADIDLNEIVRDHAMLVSVHIRGSRFEIKDNAAAAAAAEKSGAASSAAYYAKKNLLFTADTELKRLHAIGAALRNRHIELTMAWETGKSPYRMLPVMNFQTYTQAISKAKKQYEAALDDFVEKYPANCAKARKALNLPDTPEVLRMYPRLDELRQKFGIEVTFEPIAEGAQFRNIPDSAAEALRNKFEEQVSARFKRAIAESYENMDNLLDTAIDNLGKDPGEKGQRWKNSTIWNITDAAQIMRTFNFLGDEEHERFCELVDTRLGGYSEKELKELRKPDADRQGLIDNLVELQVRLQNLATGSTV